MPEPSTNDLSKYSSTVARAALTWEERSGGPGSGEPLPPTPPRRRWARCSRLVAEGAPGWTSGGGDTAVARCLQAPGSRMRPRASAMMTHRSDASSGNSSDDDGSS